MYDESKSSRSDVTAEAAPSQAASGSTLMRCAYCGNKFQKESSPIVPFCSIRCHRADLGMWLSETYGLPWDGGVDPHEQQFE